jgi:hypothetical protein
VKETVHPAVAALGSIQVWGDAMAKISLLGLVFCLVMIAQAAAGQPSRTERLATPASAATATHPVRAVLRYDLSTAATCNSFPSERAELCVLLALHVIHLSQTPRPMPL